MDGLFGGSSIVLLVLASMILAPILLVLSIIGVATCKDDGARKKAIIALAISVPFTLLRLIAFANV